MKRVLSIILSIALVMSLFCAIPASVSAEDAPDVSEPTPTYISTQTYAFDDFEGGTEIGIANEGSYVKFKADSIAYKTVKGGSNSSEKALKVTFTPGASTVQGISSPYNLRKNTSGLTNNTVSFDYKIVTPMKSAKFRLRVATPTGATVDYYTVPDEHLTDGEWHTAFITVNGYGNFAPQDPPSCAFQLAFSYPNGIPVLAEDGVEEAEIHIDNLLFSKDNAAQYGLHYYDMSQNSWLNTRRIAGISAGDSSILVDPDDPTANVLAISAVDNSYIAHAAFYFYGPLKAGDTVTSSYKMRLYDTVTHDKKSDYSYLVTKPSIGSTTQSSGREAYSAFATESPLKHYLKKGFEGAVTWKDWHIHTFEQTIKDANVSAAGKSVYYIRAIDKADDIGKYDRDSSGKYDLEETTILFDYVTFIVNKDTATLPEVSNVSATISENVITVGYDYTETNTDATNFSNASYIKVRSKTDGKVIAVSKEKTIVLPEEYKDAKLKVEVIPVCDNTNICGVPVVVDVEKYYGTSDKQVVNQAIGRSYIEIGGDSIEATAKVIDKNGADLQDQSMTFLTLNEDKTVVSGIKVVPYNDGSGKYRISADSTVVPGNYNILARSNAYHDDTSPVEKSLAVTIYSSVEKHEQYSSYKIINTAKNGTTAYWETPLYLRAEVVDINSGSSNGIDQTINITVLDSERKSQVSGFVVTKLGNGDYVVVPEKSVPFGNYVVMAEKSTNDVILGKGINITVSAPYYDKTEIIRETSGVTIKTKDAIANGQLMFITYDENNKMVDFTVKQVSVGANESVSYPLPVGIKAGHTTKVLLWKDKIASIKPLSESLFYHEY